LKHYCLAVVKERKLKNHQLSETASLLEIKLEETLDLGICKFQTTKDQVEELAHHLRTLVQVRVRDVKLIIIQETHARAIFINLVMF
jgi:hypothetical protein